MGGLTNTNFWCHECRKDWTLPAVLGWINSEAGEAWVSHCPDCNKRLFRLKDVRAKDDPYFRRSRYIKASMRKHLDSLIQVGDSRFDMLYPEHKKKREAYFEEQERSKYGKIK